MNEEIDIRDVKGLVEIPEPPDYLLWIILALAAIIIGIVIWQILTRKKPAPGISAAKRALKELKRAERLLNKKSPEPLVVKVTDVVRNYLENRFSLAAPRQTTEEFLHAVHDNQTTDLAPWRDELGEFLRSCDVVKYGRADLEKKGRKELLKNALRFVETTAEETS